MTRDASIGENLEGAKQLHDWQYGDASNFYSRLLTLLQKADSVNRVKIAMLWPVTYHAWKEWNECESQDDYFNRYHLPLERMK